MTRGRKISGVDDIPIGTKFEKLTFLGYKKTYRNGRSRSFCKCQCECGNVIHVLRSNLLNGQAKTCGKSCRARKYANGLTIAQMAEKADVSITTIQHRLRKGLSLEEVVAPKTDRYKNGGNTVKPYEGISDYTTGDRYYWKPHDTPQPPLPTRLQNHHRRGDLEA